MMSCQNIFLHDIIRILGYAFLQPHLILFVCQIFRSILVDTDEELWWIFF